MAINNQDVPNNTPCDPFTSNRGYQGLLYSLKNLSASSDLAYLWDGSCGLDKARITIPITNSPDELKQAIHGLLGRREYKGQASFADFPDLFFSSCATPVRAARAIQVEFNFADFTKAKGLNLCPFGLAPDVVQLIIHHVVENSGWLLNPVFFPYSKSQIEPPDYPPAWKDDVDYSKLELARDFTINDPRFKLEQIQFYRPQRAKAVTPIINGYDINTLTHPAGSRSVRLEIYNKSLKARKDDPGRYPPGIFRFEAKLPRAQIKRQYIPTVQRGREDRMHFALSEYWKRSNYWKPLVHAGNVHQELLETYDRMDASLLIGYADSCAKGLADYYSEEEHKEYGTILKKHGINKFVPLERQGTPYAELDFIKGTLDY